MKRWSRPGQAVAFYLESLGQYLRYPPGIPAGTSGGARLSPNSSDRLAANACFRRNRRV